MLGLQLIVLRASTEREMETAFANVAATGRCCALCRRRSRSFWSAVITSSRSRRAMRFQQYIRCVSLLSRAVL